MYSDELDDLNSREDFLRKEIHKNCLLCMGRSRLHTNRAEKNPEKGVVLNSLQDLYGTYQEKYELLRKLNSTAEKIQNAATNKRFVLDVIDGCKSCGRETDFANRSLAQLK
ncbi:MAG TPA: hypothetical protein VJG83_01525 [archaeon]|nr:hypothetical protein [archaeon]